MLKGVVLDDGVSAAGTVFVSETLADAVGGAPLFPGDSVIIFQGAIDDTSESLLLSLSKGWGAGADSVAGNPAGQSRPASCAPCPGADRTPGRLP